MPKRYGFKCENPQARIDDVDAVIWQWVKDILLSPEKLQEAWQTHQEQRLAALQPHISLLEANEEHLAGLEEEKRRLVKAYVAGTLTLDDIAEEKKRIEKQIQDLEQAVRELRADLEPQIPTPEEMETIEEYVGQLQLGAELSDNNPEVQQAIYRHLQMEAKLTYEDDQHWADLRCILGETRLPTDYNATHVFGMTKLIGGERCRAISGRSIRTKGYLNAWRLKVVNCTG